MTEAGEPPWAAVRRRVLGPDLPAAQSPSTAAEAAFAALVTDEIWMGVWDRPGLDMATRRAVTIGVLVALGRPEGLTLHVRGALADGMGAEEISEIVLHCALYCGVPAADAAYRVIRPLLAEAARADVAADPDDG
jgi:alkylhydroperoxidase/carboxymuconolactone decarboxylase family protein YurZ